MSIQRARKWQKQDSEPRQPAPEPVHSTSFQGQAAPAWWALKPYSLLALDSEDALLPPRRHVLLSLLVKLVLLQAQLKGVPLCAPWPAVLQQKWFEFLNLCVYLFPNAARASQEQNLCTFGPGAKLGSIDIQYMFVE